MEKFKFLEHTADTFIESYGKNLEEAFENSAKGLMKLMIENIEETGSEISKKIEVQGNDLQELLFEFLTQFLIYHDAENLVFSKVNVKKINKNDKYSLVAEISGEEFDPEKHEGGVAVKAITYHEMQIDKKPEKVTVKVLVDI